MKTTVLPTPSNYRLKFMGIRVLVVDDSVTMRMVVQAAFLDVGWQVTTASNGKEALDLAQQQHFDLVVSDLNMPVMHGLEFIGNMRQHSANQDVPVLVLTTEDDDASKETAAELGVYAWVHKPVDPDTLVALSQDLLDGLADENSNGASE